MQGSESPSARSARYRRLANECLDIARTFPKGARRTVLLQMAQVWQRLADQYADSSMSSPTEGALAPMQQQQQIQPARTRRNSLAQALNFHRDETAQLIAEGWASGLRQRS